MLPAESQLLIARECAESQRRLSGGLTVEKDHPLVSFAGDRIFNDAHQLGHDAVQLEILGRVDLGDAGRL
jgi:hypothetical protein